MNSYNNYYYDDEKMASKLSHVTEAKMHSLTSHRQQIKRLFALTYWYVT